MTPMSQAHLQVGRWHPRDADALELPALQGSLGAVQLEARPPQLRAAVQAELHGLARTQGTVTPGPQGLHCPSCALKLQLSL